MVLGGLVLLASGVPLTQVTIDRADPPLETLVLSNRELMVGWTRDENSGVTLTWSWGSVPQVDSLTRAELDSIGVRCPGTGYDCDWRSGTRGWVVVGLDTVAWQRSVDSARHILDSIGVLVPGDSLAKPPHDDALNRLKQLELYTSRLRMVAVGRDPEALAAAWDDGKHLMLQARLWVYRQSYPREGRPGEVPLFSVNATPVPGALYVPVQWASVVEDSTGARERVYQVTVAVGRRWLPRIVEVRKVAAPAWSAETP